MVRNHSYTSVDEILSRVLRHPLLQDVTREQAVQYVIDFMYILGCPGLFKEEEVTVPIDRHRGELPCDVVSVDQVRDSHGRCLRAVTDTFMKGPHPDKPYPYAFPDRKPPLPWGFDQPRIHGRYVGEPQGHLPRFSEPTFSVHGRYIFTSFPQGVVDVAYKSIPVDEHGFPMLVDNPVFLATLEAYIKKQAFTVLFDTGVIKSDVLNNALQDYSFKAGQCQSEFTMPSISEIQAMANMWCSLIPNMSTFYRGFRDLGDRERFLKH